MGAESSKPLLSEPWRKIGWINNETDLKLLRSYKPQTECQQIRILLHGPAGAGKSSFINSVKSTLLRKILVQALVDNISHDSFTKKYTSYKIPKGDRGTFYPLVFNDVMGLDPSRGVPVEDVKLALKGHVKDGYPFNPGHRITEDNPCYNKSPDFTDKVQVLVLVISADTVTLMTDKMVKKIQDIRREASTLEIPQLAIITKIDQVGPEVQKDLKKIYKIQCVRERMERLSVDTGIPMNCIFPVKNYHDEINVDNDTDTLILSALKHIINVGEDHISFVENKNPSFNRYA